MVAWVPRRSAALARMTEAWIRSVFTRPPNTASLSSIEPTFWFCELTTSTVMAPYFLPFFGFSWSCGCGSGLAATALRIST